jgi:hypothetical protein
VQCRLNLTLSGKGLPLRAEGAASQMVVSANGRPDTMMPGLHPEFREVGEAQDRPDSAWGVYWLSCSEFTIPQHARDFGSEAGAGSLEGGRNGQARHPCLR